MRFPSTTSLPILASISISLSISITSVLSAPSSSSSSPSSQFPDRYDADEIFRLTDLDDGDGTGDDSKGWVDPRENGGSMLDLVGNGLREPINVIISGKSDPTILSDAGLRDYVRTIGFSFECLDLHLGGLQRANLGDGTGWTPENFEYRETQWPGSPGRWVGACWESLYGGNHFRVWKQNGTLANTGAWFLAVSKEKNLRRHHTIDHDGYNVGRDLLVQAALKGGIWKSWQWRAQVEWIDGLLEVGRHGINHNISQDGRTAVLTVDRILDGSLTPLPYPHAHQSQIQTLEPQDQIFYSESQEQDTSSYLEWSSMSSIVFRLQQRLKNRLQKLF